jgi:hypothetical protein
MSTHDLNLMTAIIETTEPGSTPGVTVTRFNPGGDPHAAALVDAVVDRYADVTGRDPVSNDDLLARAGAKVSLLTTGSNMLGAPLVTARPGTLFAGSTGPALLPKGKRSNGIGLSRMDVLDLEPGYAGVSVLADRVATVKAGLPTLEPLTLDHLRALPRATGDGRSAACTLAVFGSWAMPDGRIPGSIWLCAEYSPEDDVVDGVLLVPHSGESEHGSVYGQQLLAARMGAVVGFAGVSFRDAVVDLTDDYEAALRLVAGR